MRTTIVIPIIRFNEYSIHAMKKLNSIPYYKNLKFLFAVSSKGIAIELSKYITDFKNIYEIKNCNSIDSNFLRKQATYVDTEFIYYNDCDDWADYELINNETEKLSSDREVVCFQIERLIVNSLDDITSAGIITWPKECPNIRIEDLSVNVYSKLIPTHYLKDVDFPNLPFTQDWAISYSLYLLAPHRMVEKKSYYYYNYPTSSSNARYDTIYRLNRVYAYGRTLLEKYKKNRSRTEYEFLKYRYNTCLGSRYLKLGINIKPYFPSLFTFFHVNLHTKLEIGNQSIKKILSMLKH
ncbi:hypothetical protein [uncultured Duncaniella sp.]|uniref:hypothetical protein n=1 Tax=uncultured Duncaniella sp. TaxID=2768039 RepID=UPI00272F8614|nr:hypothetical protein [uncultured Duncaniella sp.]